MRTTARVLRYAASGFLVLLAGLGALFAAGYAYADLPLWHAVSATLAWLVVAGGLAWLAWRRPGTAVPVLLGVTGAVAALTVLDAQVDVFGRDQRGPVVTVTILAVLVPLATLALRRATAAGLLLLVLGVFQALAAGLLHGGGPGWGALLGTSSGVVVLPVLLAALLLLLSGWLAHEPPGSLRPGGVRTAH